jgi:hypothetical protein
MDEPRTAVATSAPTASAAGLAPAKITPPTFRIDLLLLLALAGLTLGLRVFQIGTTEVTARDSISYIHIAWRLEHGDWREVIPTSPQHPGYPIAVLTASLPVRFLVPNDLPYAWQLSAQLASAGASVLLVIPLYYLGRELFDRRVAFWAALLLQCLPSSGTVFADGLSEPLFLLCAASSLVFAAVALRRGWGVGFALAGGCGGLAYWTRPEGVLLPAAAGAVLLIMQALPRRRRPWGKVVACGACLVFAALAVGGPYSALIRGFTVKRTGNQVIGNTQPGESWNPPVEDDSQSCVSGGPAPLAMWRTEETWGGRWGWAARALAYALSKGFFYVGWIPALAGLWWFRGRLRESSAAWMVLLLCGTVSAALYLVAALMGYLSDRHTLLIVMCGVFWAAAGVAEAGRRLASLAAAALPALAGRGWTAGRLWSGVLLSVLAVAPLVRTLERLHGDRTGFRDAGRWLAGHVGPNDVVFDPFGWAGYYAGRCFRDDYEETLFRPDIRYIVLEVSENDHSHLPTVKKAKDLAKRTPAVWSFSVRRGKKDAAVEIHYVPPELLNPPGGSGPPPP